MATARAAGFRCGSGGSRRDAVTVYATTSFSSRRFARLPHDLVVRTVAADPSRTELFERVTAMIEPDRILRIRTVLHRTGLSRSTLYRKINNGSFPRQLQIGEHSAGWRESAVNRWMEDPETYRSETSA